MIIRGPGFVAPQIGFCPFRFRIDGDGAIKLYGDVRRADGTVVVEATGDNITALPNTGFDVNSDARACEVVDSDKNPIYQMSIVSVDRWKNNREESVSKALGRNWAGP